MTSTPLLSVLLTTHTKQKYLEQLLDSLLSFDSPSLEVILINDAADPAVTEALHRIFSSTSHKHAFLFEHELTLGRGRSLNEALLSARGQLVWAPLRADKLNESLLSETITRFSRDPAAFWILDDTLPRDINAWADAAEEGTLPDDSRFVWNRTVISPEQFYFQPSLNQYHGCELAARIAPGKSWQSTDAFFIVPRESGPAADMNVLQEILLTQLRNSTELNERMLLLEALGTLRSAPKGKADITLNHLELAWQQKDEDPRKALDAINLYLRKEPADAEAVKLKILLLEKLRRHVEASELKHDLQRQALGASNKNENSSSSAHNQRPAGDDVPTQTESTAPASSDNIKLSVVIPTTGDCKPMLEECLVNLYNCVNPEETELIVIDNASIDDTFDYLEQLKQKNYLNIHVITNQQNRGFGPSVNQGLKKANGRYVLIMHNDLFPKNDCIHKLILALEKDPKTGISGPLLDSCDNPDQLIENQLENSDQLEEQGSPDSNPDGLNAGAESIRLNGLDSCCMLLRKSAGVFFDESFTPAFFDDLDLCNQLAEAGYHAVLAPGAVAEHRHRVTTAAMGLLVEPEQEWRNAGLYMNKWNGNQEIPEPDMDDAIKALWQLELPINPLNPPDNWMTFVTRLLSDETRTTILQGKSDTPFLLKLVEILMIADERELLRRIETRLEGAELPEELLMSLIRYYYGKNIYSRCRYYLEKASKTHAFFDLYRLRIAVAEKEEERAVALLNRLIKEFPCHPEIYKLTGDIHQMNGNEGEAKSFHALANQLNPGLVQGEGEAFEIRH